MFMNIVIEDGLNKKYHPFIYCTENQTHFIMSNIVKINSKLGMNLTVYENVDTNEFDDKGFEVDQGIFDRYIHMYNSNLNNEEEPLSLWIRD